IFVLKSLDDLPDLERKVLEPQGIQSMVQFGILDKGKMLGFMGFDNCRGNALRNNEEIGEISAICNILATFFIKQRADDVTVKEAQLQVEVMNRLNNYIFVVDAHTYEVLFMNHKTMQFIGERECHMPCYQFFRQHRYPCTDCPIKALKEAGEAQATREIYNEYLEMWVKISASTLRWKDERQVYLLECADITKQREEHLRHIDQLEQLAFVDELTGSRSFYKFKKDAQQILQDKEDTRYFLVKLDIDNFKLVNQLYGYEKGDEILCCVAEAIQKTTRNEEEIFARISSDEFVALFAMGDGIINRELHHKFLDIFYGLLDPGIVFQFTFSYGIYVITR
ncbi:MAG: GGDEF domain-containing protein, partial [Oscillospiraceae bacterium]